MIKGETLIKKVVIAIKQKSPIREAITEKTVKLGEKFKSLLLPPSPPLTWETLTVMFFIIYLGSRDIDKDFEINLLFSFTKVVYHLDYFGVLYLMFQHQNFDYSKCQSYPPKNSKKYFICLFCISDHSKYFWKKLLKQMKLRKSDQKNGIVLTHPLFVNSKNFYKKVNTD